jgi:hypothetical protein
LFTGGFGDFHAMARTEDRRVVLRPSQMEGGIGACRD